jgi:hypothetical protein
MDLVVEDSVFRSGGTAIRRTDGSWWGLVFNRNTVETTSTEAIYWYNHSDNVSITENTMTNGGIRAHDLSYAKGTYDISRNTLQGDNAYIYFYGYSGRSENNQGSWVKIDDNIIKNVSSSSYDPIYVNRSYGDVSISNNVLDNLSSNRTYVINFQNNDDYPNTLKIDNNTISSKKTAMYVYHSNGLDNVSIANNRISRDQTYTSCCYYGVMAYYLSGVIENNEISDFAGGIYLEGSFDYPSRTTMRYNTITNNNHQNRSDKAGIYLNKYAQPVINYNNLDNNSIDLFNNTDASVYSEIDAKYNYWGETTTASMDAGSNPKNLDAIYDMHDDSDKGFVNYGGWLNGSWPDGVATAITKTGTVLMTDPSGSEQLNFASGSTLFVRVTDADRNGNTGSAETVIASLSSQTETNAETVTLTESGPNTGIFVGSIVLDQNAVVSGDSKLQVSRGDKLTAVYADPADDFGNAKDVKDSAFYSVSLVSGEIASNETWSTSANPYW